MADSQAQLEHLDRLMADLGRALADRDWDALAQLNNKVQPAVEPLMAALETGELEPEPVRHRLEQLQQFIDAADESARIARKEAEAGLKGVNRNRSAARAYQNISSNPRK
ncbi:SOS cell division inhibitor [Marinobacter sp. Arc7-DN-1]|uniref:SOS cell division inhibitor n=1 Tax=Marinobacter sp. Arc7-DN-1 TaxID=2304594 RepID=UPI000E4422B7|nr:SOS cell division inhibitor [Marinobacter sp. Arc7-DN-1]AXS82434.1 SOS cell division inhibitor [Marinobacter sp. Arc7-DN-1]